MESARLTDELKKLLGASQVLAGPHELISYASDMFPRNQILKLAKELPQVRPGAIVFPESSGDLCRVLAFCWSERIPVIPYGAGSGVCGAGCAEEGAVVIDTKRLTRIVAFSPQDRTVTVEPGLLGEHLEEWLNARGFTLGHFPSSIACSTVGGWVACRSAGQFSSRYGKIEQMTLGLEVALPEGRLGRFGVLGGGHHRDPMLAVFVGSEGTLGLVTQACLRVEPLPEKLDFRGFAFLDVEDGLACMRKTMQAGLAPTVLRLYDPLDSLIAGVHTPTAGGEDVHWAASRLAGTRKLLADAVTDLNETGMALALYRPGLLNRIAEILPARSLLIAGVQGKKAEVERQWTEIAALAASCRGDDLGPEPGQAWYKRRYAISYKQCKVFRAGAFVDTMEVATTWDNLLPMYRAVLKAMGGHVFIMAHFSHAYREGCSIYFTFAGYRPSVRAALSVYQKAWRAGLEAVVRYRGAVSHHHGIGLLKRWAMSREVPGGREFFSAFKKVLDGRGIMNPGKLYPTE
jgi:alkyldihydroxyacetonephosphate synthase